MAVSEDNRGGRDRSVPQRPDGSWSFEDARKRRQQRQAAQTPPAPPTPGEAGEDLSALALSLADNLTIDGTPLSQLETRQEHNGGDALGLPAGDPPSAEEIIRALEAEQHAAASNRSNGPEPPRPARPPHRPSAWPGQHRRRLRPRRPSVIACTLGAAVATLLAVQATLSGGPTAREQRGRSAASGTTAPGAAVIAAATDKFLAIEHASDRDVGSARTRSARLPRPRRHRQTAVRVAAHHPSGSRSASTTTSSTSGTSQVIDTTQQANRSGSSPSSSSTSSGSGQPPPATQTHTSPNSTSSSGSSSSTPSKAALKSLVTGAGTCSCQ
jgi:hypothetical protein